MRRMRKRPGRPAAQALHFVRELSGDRAFNLAPKVMEAWRSVTKQGKFDKEKPISEFYRGLGTRHSSPTTKPPFPAPPPIL